MAFGVRVLTEECKVLRVLVDYLFTSDRVGCRTSLGMRVQWVIEWCL